MKIISNIKCYSLNEVKSAILREGCLISETAMDMVIREHYHERCEPLEDIEGVSIVYQKHNGFFDVVTSILFNGVLFTPEQISSDEPISLLPTECRAMPNYMSRRKIIADGLAERPNMETPTSETFEQLVKWASGFLETYKAVDNLATRNWNSLLERLNKLEVKNLPATDGCTKIIIEISGARCILYPINSEHRIDRVTYIPKRLMSKEEMLMKKIDKFFEEYGI